MSLNTPNMFCFVYLIFVLQSVAFCTVFPSTLLVFSLFCVGELQAEAAGAVGGALGERGSGGAMPEDHPCVSHVLSPPGSFSKGVAEGEVDPSFGPLEAIRLSIQTDSPVWIILSEVSQAPSAPPHPCPAHCSDLTPLFFQIFIKKAE